MKKKQQQQLRRPKNSPMFLCKLFEVYGSTLTDLKRAISSSSSLLKTLFIHAIIIIGSISAVTVSRVRSLILPEEGDECGLIFPNSGW